MIGFDLAAWARIEASNSCGGVPEMVPPKFFIRSCTSGSRPAAVKSLNVS
jgi:hypothetical protein